MKPGAEDDDDSELSDAAQVGLPTDPVKAFRKIKQKRLKRVRDFVEHRDSPWLMLLWLSICPPLLRIHFDLFSYGTWRSHCQDELLRRGVFEFIDPARSPAVAALRVFAAMLSAAQLDREAGAGRVPGEWPREHLGRLGPAVAAKHAQTRHSHQSGESTTPGDRQWRRASGCSQQLLRREHDTLHVRPALLFRVRL